MTQAMKLDLDTIQAAAKAAGGDVKRGEVAAFVTNYKCGYTDDFYRLSSPAVVFELIRRLRSAESLVAARIVEVSTDSVAVALIGDLKPDNIRELKAFHDALRAQRNPTALVVCVQAPSDLMILDVDQMRKIGWVRAPEEVVPE